MATLRVIGDVHERWEAYKKLCENQLTIQLGDLGFESIHNLQKDLWNQYRQNYVVFGNHDHYPFVGKQYSLNGCYIFGDLRVACIRGAESVDKQYRTNGIDCFANEELSYAELANLTNEITCFEPDVIISHDCPQFLTPFFGVNDKTRTRQALESLYLRYSPTLWLFGHHHTAKVVVHDTTTFICLSELQYLDLAI